MGRQKGLGNGKGGRKEELKEEKGMLKQEGGKIMERKEKKRRKKTNMDERK